MDNTLTHFVDRTKVEAARYVLMRRLGYVFRHHLVGTLQPINVMSQVLQLKLKAVPLDVSTLSESVSKTGGMVRAAIDSCLDVFSWFADGPCATVWVSLGVEECVSYLRSSFSVHGFVIQNEEANLQIPVDKAALREVLTALLIAGADHAYGNSEICVSVYAISGTVEIAMQVRPGKSTSTPDPGAYRALEWDEVEALAISHDVGFRRISDAHVKIRISPFLDSSAG